MAIATTATREDGELTHRQILTVLGGLMLGMFLAALDQTVVSTAIRTIADDLQGLSLQAWATTAFLITSTITTPLYGKLSDIFGRKPLFMTAISIFLIGSVACTLAWSMYSLAAFRALQGLGAGGLMSLALTILGDIVPPRERARYQGFFLAVFGTSSVIGPVIGGLLSGVDTIAGIDGWRWIFLVNVPIGLVALVVVYRVLNIPHLPRRARIDWPGALALALGLVPLLIVAEQGREWGWASTNAIVCYAVGAVGLVLFLTAERAYGDDALLPLRLFRTGIFSLSSVINLLIGMSMFGAIALLPQFLQIVHGATPIEAGFMMLPLVGGIMISSITSGQLTSRTGRYKIFPVLGTAFITVAMLLLWRTLTPEIPILQLDLTMFLLGLGLGLCMQTLVLAVQNAMPARDMGVTTSTVTFFRQMGGTIGTAVFLSVVFSTAGDRISGAIRGALGTESFRSALADPAVAADPANRAVVEALQSGQAGGLSASVLTDSSFLQRIDARLAAPFQAGFTSSMALAFLIAACVIALAFVLVLFVKELPLRSMSGAQAARAEEEARRRAEAGAEPITGVAAEPAVGASASPVPTGDVGTATVAPAPAGDRTAEGHTAPATTPIPVIGRAGAATAHAAGSPSGDTGRPGPAVPAPAAPTGGPVPSPASDGVLPDGPGPAEIARPHVGDRAVLGRVRSGSGAGLSGATVTVTRLSGVPAGHVTTGDDGHYRIALDEPGRYLVVVAAGARPPHAATVSIGAGPVAHEVRLGDGSAVRGTVLDAAGRPASGVTVALIDGRGEVAGTGRSGADGRYDLPGVPPGHYTLTAAGEDVDPVAVGVRVPATGSVEQDLQLPQRSRLTGRVTAAPDGGPVAQAVATLIDADGEVVGTRVSGADGTFSFDELPAGTYTLATSGYPPVADVVELEAGRVTHSDVEFPHPLHDARPGNGRHVRDDEHGSRPR
ncbi:MFS transporter [Pseudonocardia nematodicida]|uniref:MFS transporter n=1 Tax=Pseudonocardia nematodicida TaxID=1206997 RepID=A0ABV1K9X8_9PSEU